MFSPTVLEAYDSLFTSSPLIKESETSPEPQMPQSAPFVSSTNETTDLFESDSEDEDPTMDRHWYLFTRRWSHQRSRSQSSEVSNMSDMTESLQLKALLSPAFSRPSEKRMANNEKMNFGIEVMEIEESKV